MSDGFAFEDCLLKHYIRKEVWLPFCRDRLKKIRASTKKEPRRLRYFTFCAVGALDVLRSLQPVPVQDTPVGQGDHRRRRRLTDQGAVRPAGFLARVAPGSPGAALFEGLDPCPDFVEGVLHRRARSGKMSVPTTVASRNSNMLDARSARATSLKSTPRSVKASRRTLSKMPSAPRHPNFIPRQSALFSRRARGPEDRRARR